MPGYEAATIGHDFLPELSQLIAIDGDRRVSGRGDFPDHGVFEKPAMRGEDTGGHCQVG